MRNKAKKLANYLETHLGWSVHDEHRICKCGESSYDKKDKFCTKCGSKLGKMKPIANTIDELEEALIFAFKK